MKLIKGDDSSVVEYPHEVDGGTYEIRVIQEFSTIGGR